MFKHLQLIGSDKWRLMRKNDDNGRRATSDNHEDIVQVNTQEKLNVTCT